MTVTYPYSNVASCYIADYCVLTRHIVVADAVRIIQRHGLPLPAVSNSGQRVVAKSTGKPLQYSLSCKKYMIPPVSAIVHFFLKNTKIPAIICCDKMRNREGQWVALPQEVLYRYKNINTIQTAVPLVNLADMVYKAMYYPSQIQQHYPTINFS